LSAQRSISVSVLLALHFRNCSTFPTRIRRKGVALLAVVLTATVQGHPEIEAALTRLNEQIATAPASAELYLERGQLYAKHADWISAEANYLRAAELAPSLPRLDSMRGALALANGAFLEARSHLDRAVGLNARDPEALILRSRSRAALNDRAGAADDLATALEILPNPRPELFLEYAGLSSTPADAIRILDAGMARIGLAHTLQQRALELEEAGGRIDDALTRLQRIADLSERKEMWLKRRGDLLARVGRTTEARAAYAAALAAIAALPDWLRESPDTTRLTAELTRSVPSS
jgi:tetratricopeptide (TPR) repeat protein